MSLFQQAEAIFLVLLALLLSMVIGYNRERLGIAAGLRTHMLVGVGSCLFTLMSYLAFPDADRSRVAAAIVTGIGFLGAGTILKQDQSVKGLTTAASIWYTAAVGMAVGLGAWLLAIAATVIGWFILVIVKRLPVREHHDDDDGVWALNLSDEVGARGRSDRRCWVQGARAVISPCHQLGLRR